MPVRKAERSRSKDPQYWLHKGESARVKSTGQINRGAGCGPY